MKPVNVKSNTYLDSSKEINEKDPKFKIGDTVRLSKHKNIFANSCTSNWDEEVFVIKKVKNAASQLYVMNDLNGEEIVGTFFKKELQKTNQKELELKKQSRKKVINHMLNGKDTTVCLIAGQIKRTV